MKNEHNKIFKINSTSQIKSVLLKGINHDENNQCFIKSDLFKCLQKTLEWWGYLGVLIVTKCNVALFHGHQRLKSLRVGASTKRWDWAGSQQQALRVVLLGHGKAIIMQVGLGPPDWGGVCGSACAHVVSDMKIIFSISCS